MPRAVPPCSLSGLKSGPGSKMVRAHVRAGATFYPHGDDPIYPSRGTGAREIHWKDSTAATLTSLTWEKKMGAPAASWSATIKTGRDARIDPVRRGDILGGDWGSLLIQRNGVEFWLGTGIVDSVTWDTRSAGGAKVNEFVINGKDHGGLFESQIAWNNIFVQSFAELAGGLHTQAVGGKVGGTPDDLFKVLITGTFGQGTSKNRSAWTLPRALSNRLGIENELTGKGTFLDALNINTNPTRGAYYNEMQLHTKPGGQLHQAFAQWCNPLLNEFYYDVAESASDQLDATIRERPFINTTEGMASPWFSLLETEVPYWLVLSSSLGRSDRERFTIFEILADYVHGNSQEQSGMAPPQWSRDGIERYGVRPFIESTKQNQTIQGPEGGWVRVRQEWQKLVRDWYAPNPYWLSGTVNLGIIAPEIRIGTRLRVRGGTPEDDFTAYVEGVRHSYKYAIAGPSSRTSLTVTRGHYGKDKDRLDVVKKSAALFKEKF